jgi:hypothetical protein
MTVQTPTDPQKDSHQDMMLDCQVQWVGHTALVAENISLTNKWNPWEKHPWKNWLMHFLLEDLPCIFICRHVVSYSTRHITMNQFYDSILSPEQSKWHHDLVPEC